MKEKRNSRAGIVLAGLVAAGAYLVTRGAAAGAGAGGGFMAGGEAAPNRAGQPQATSSSEGAPAYTGERSDPTITRLARTEDDAQAVKDLQEQARNDPDKPVGRITGGDPADIEADVTASAGGGRGPRFDSESGGEAILSPSDDEESGEDETSSAEPNVSTGSMPGDTATERGRKRAMFSGSGGSGSSGDDEEDETSSREGSKFGISILSP